MSARIAFLFPGQGMEAPAMGLSIAEAHRAARELLAAASELCAEDLPRLLARGGPALQRTEILQPCLTAVALGALEVLTAEGVRAELVAGHSLGELAAAAGAGYLTATEAVELARHRGVLMAREARQSPGAMLAALATADEVRGVLERHALDLAAHNAPDEWVLSGELVQIRAAGRELPSARRLPVSGAWHGRAMAGAVMELEALLRALRPGPARARAICNATGEEVDGAELLRLIAGQLTRPVRWARAMTTLERAGVTDLVAVGPGHVLRGLARKNLGQRIRVHTTEDAEDLARTVELLQG